MQHLTKECDDAMSKEIAALKRENMSVIDFKPDGVPEARILQYRVFPIPKQKIMIFQVRAPSSHALEHNLVSRVVGKGMRRLEFPLVAAFNSMLLSIRIANHFEE